MYTSHSNQVLIPFIVTPILFPSLLTQNPHTCTCCSSILSLFNFIFFCFMFTIIYLHKQEQRKIKIEPRIKLNHNIHTVFPPFRITFRKCCFHSWYIPGIVKVGEGRGGGIWFKSVGEVSIYYLKKIPISHS